MMNINSVQITTPTNPIMQPFTAPPVIEPVDIKAILYLGLRGEVSLPSPERTVDILV